MKTILIDRRTIRENPEYGNIIHSLQGAKQIYVSFYTDIHNAVELFKGSDKRFSAISMEACDSAKGDVKISGNVLNEDFIIDARNYAGLSIQISRENIDARSIGIASKYLYEYENTKLKCEDCGKSTPFNEIEEKEVDLGYDYYYDKVCPHCGGYNTFEDYQLENINDVKL